MSLTKVSYSMITGTPVNVLDYGADPSGAADSTAAITLALAAGSNIYFPPGTYKTTSSIAIPFGTNIQGQNATINVAFDGNGFTVASGLSNAISATVTSATTIGSSASVTSTSATVSSTSGFAVGNLVSVAGTNGQTFFSYIESISGTTITFSDYAPYTLTNTCTLSLITPANISISGLTMYHGVSSVSAANYLLNVLGSFVTVENCYFGNNTYTVSNCFTTVGAYNVFKNNTINNVGTAFQAYNSAHCLVSQNKISNFSGAVRLVISDSCQVIDNDIQNGVSDNAPYGLGIELTGQSTSYDKNCRHLIKGNTVIAAQLGVAGSGIGGIHLNFSGNYNRVIGNTCRLNTFGIYLENNNCYNVIEGNICTDQTGYYGVGIELDWDNSYNTILNNVCSNNRGSTTALESAGIELRGSVGNHPNMYNVVSGNTCEGNGLVGIWCDGQHNTISGNTVTNNAVDVVAMNTAGGTQGSGWGIRLLGDSQTVVGNNITQSAYDSRATTAFSQMALAIEGATNPVVNGNLIYAGYYAVGAIRSYATGTGANIIVTNNNIQAVTVSSAAISFNGQTGVYLNNNIVNQNSNGADAIDVLNVTGFSIFGNVLNGATTTVTTTGSTNRYTPANN